MMEQLMDRVTITTRPVGTSVHLCKRVGPVARARERPAPADGDPLHRNVAP